MPSLSMDCLPQKIRSGEPSCSMAFFEGLAGQGTVQKVAIRFNKNSAISPLGKRGTHRHHRGLLADGDNDYFAGPSLFDLLNRLLDTVFVIGVDDELARFGKTGAADYGYLGRRVGNVFDTHIYLHGCFLSKHLILVKDDWKNIIL